MHGRIWRRLAEQFRIDAEQPPRLLISRAAKHRTIDMIEMRLRSGDGDDAAVDRDRHIRQRRLEPIDPVIVERRDVAVFFWRQSIEPGLARMNNQHIRASRNDGPAQHIKCDFRVLIVNADAAFHCDRNLDGLLHRRDTLRNQLRLGHQAGAEVSTLHAIGRTADIHVDFVVAEVFADFRALREIARVRSAKLKCDGMLARIETEQPLAITVDDRAGGHHLGIEQCAARQQAMEDAAMPVSPVHHRRNGEDRRLEISIFFFFLNALRHQIYDSFALVLDQKRRFKH